VLVAIDARGRGVSVGFFEPDGQGRYGPPLAVRRIGASSGRSPDEIAVLLDSFARALGEREGGGARKPDQSWMSCVVPSLSRDLSLAVEAAFGIPCSAIGPGVKTGVRIRTDIPSEVGSDLICAAAASRDLVGGACVAIDFDAVLAFSAIGRAGDFLGAAFAPGMGEAARSMRASGALLPEVSIPLGAADRACRAIGRNTPESVRAGLSLGYAGLVERIARRQAEELAALGEADSPGDVAVICTGGDEGREVLAAIASDSLARASFVPDLVLRGVAAIAARSSRH